MVGNGSLTVKMIVDPRLKHVEARARLIRLLIANTAARELIKVLARIHPLLHERHHPFRGFLAGLRVAHAIRAVPLPDTGFVLQWKSFVSFLSRSLFSWAVSYFYASDRFVEMEKALRSEPRESVSNLARSEVYNSRCLKGQTKVENKIRGSTTCAGNWIADPNEWPNRIQ